MEGIFDKCWWAEVDESEIFVFGRVSDGGEKLIEVEAAMTSAVLQMMVLGTGWVVTSLKGEDLTPGSYGVIANNVRRIG